jgi:hypothetical protein
LQPNPELEDRSELDDATELLLDFSSVLELDEGLDPSWLSPLRMTLDEDVSIEESSSARGEKLLSSSPQAVRLKAIAHTVNKISTRFFDFATTLLRSE